MIFKSLLEVIDPIDSVSLCLVNKDTNEILDIFQKICNFFLTNRGEACMIHKG